MRTALKKKEKKKKTEDRNLSTVSAETRLYSGCSTLELCFLYMAVLGVTLVSTANQRMFLLTELSSMFVVLKPSDVSGIICLFFSSNPGALGSFQME